MKKFSLVSLVLNMLFATGFFYFCYYQKKEKMKIVTECVAGEIRFQKLILEKINQGQTVEDLRSFLKSSINQVEKIQLGWIKATR